MKDLSGTLGCDFNIDCLGGVAKPSAAAVERSGKPSQSGAAAAVPPSIVQMKSLKFQAEKLGFVEGASASLQKSEEVHLYRIDSISDEKAVLIEQKLGEDGVILEVKTDVLVSEWRVHKGKVQCMLKGWPSSGSPLSSQPFLFDIVKGCIFEGIRREYEKHAEVLAKVKVLQNPPMVVAMQDFGPDSLILVAAAPRVDQKESTGGISMGHYNIGNTRTELFLPSHFVAPFTSSDEPAKAPWVSPFWIVQRASSGCNLTLNRVVRKVIDCTVTVPILQNKEFIAKGTVLVADMQAKEADVAEQPPKKRRAAAQ